VIEIQLGHEDEGTGAASGGSGNVSERNAEGLLAILHVGEQGRDGQPAAGVIVELQDDGMSSGRCDVLLAKVESGRQGVSHLRGGERERDSAREAVACVADGIGCDHR